MTLNLINLTRELERKKLRIERKKNLSFALFSLIAYDLRDINMMIFFCSFRSRVFYAKPLLSFAIVISPTGIAFLLDDKSMMKSSLRFAVARDCSRSFSHLSVLFPISQGNVRLGYSAVGFPNSGNFAREIKRAKWERENHAVEPYDSSARVTRGSGEKTNVVTDKIDRTAIDDCVQDLHFEGGYYATFYGQRERTQGMPDEHLTLLDGECRKWRVGSLQELAIEMKKGKIAEELR